MFFSLLRDNIQKKSKNHLDRTFFCIESNNLAPGCIQYCTLLLLLPSQKFNIFKKEILSTQLNIRIRPDSRMQNISSTLQYLPCNSSEFYIRIISHFLFQNLAHTNISVNRSYILRSTPIGIHKQDVIILTSKENTNVGVGAHYFITYINLLMYKN